MEMEKTTRYYIVTNCVPDIGGSCFLEELTDRVSWSGHKLLQHSDYVYDKYDDGTWYVIKDRSNGRTGETGVVPRDEDLVMMMLSAKPASMFTSDYY